MAKKTTETSEIHTKRPPVLPPPERKVTFEEWKSTVMATYPELYHPMLLCGCLTVGPLINSVTQPLGVILVGSASGGKTTSIRLYCRIPELSVYVDNLTAASFVSHATTKTTKELKDVDLLPRIRYRTLNVKDMGSVFTAGVDTMRALFGRMLSIFDGEGFTSVSGVHGKRGYGADPADNDYTFMFLGATTPPSSAIYPELARLGPRVYFYYLPYIPDTEEEVKARQRRAGKAQAIHCQEITRDYVRGLAYVNGERKEFSFNMSRLPVELEDACAKLARLTTVGRSTDDSILQERKGPERWQRCYNTYLQLATQHSFFVSQGREIGFADAAPCLALALDSINPPYNEVVRHVVWSGRGEANVDEIARVLRVSDDTARRVMKETVAQGIGEIRDDCTQPGRPRTLYTLHGTEFAWLLEPRWQAIVWKGYGM